MSFAHASGKRQTAYRTCDSAVEDDEWDILGIFYKLVYAHEEIARGLVDSTLVVAPSEIAAANVNDNEIFFRG